jgi:hypothetical protein
MPEPLAEAVSHIQPWQWWLVLYRPALEQADQGLKLIVDQSEMLANYLPDTSKGVEAIETSRAFISEILTRSVEIEILDRFRAINEDILGAYWINASKIQIYWMPLAIFAPLLRVPLRTLTIAVLCHELVHAYTHRGVDLNGQSWPTDHFIATDTYVKEGLAQYYTEKIMRELGVRLPDALAVFLAKTAKQAPPYTAYQNWLGDQRQPSPEVTRWAMREFRNSEPPMFGHDQFIDLLRSEPRTRGRKSRTPTPDDMDDEIPF